MSSNGVCPRCRSSDIMVYDTRYPKIRRQRYFAEYRSGYTETQIYYCVCKECKSSFSIDTKVRVRVR